MNIKKNPDMSHITFIEETDSPWNEKALIKRKKDYLDVKITIWEDSSFLYGRIYRLFLYI